jgi:hypothetical protein
MWCFSLLENDHRKDFLPSEIEAIRRALEPYERAAAKERQRQHGGTAPGRSKHSAKVSPSVGRTVNRIGAFAGISGRSLEKIRAVVEAAEQRPRKFGPLVSEMDRTRRIDAVYRRLRQLKDEEKRLAVKPLTGKFRTLVIDPGWESAAARGSRECPYATMSQRQLPRPVRAGMVDGRRARLPLGHGRRDSKRIRTAGALGY